MPDDPDFPPLTSDECLWLVWFEQQPEYARTPADREIAAELVMRQWLQRTKEHRELRREDIRTRPIQTWPWWVLLETPAGARPDRPFRLARSAGK